jgi:hypothetical protein
LNLSGLTRNQLNLYEQALAATVVWMKINVVLRDQNEKPIGSLSAETDWEKAVTTNIAGVIDGQVDLDWEADVTRQLSLVVSDPLDKLSFGKTVGNSAFCSVEHCIWVERLDDWVEVPVFWGPLSRFERDGHQVSLEALGKESLGLAPHLCWKTMKFPKGMLATTAIKKILQEQGETRFSLPDLKSKLHKDVIASKRSEPWRLCKRIASSVDRQLFYDPSGHVRMRRWPDHVSTVFADGLQRGY